MVYWFLIIRVDRFHAALAGISKRHWLILFFTRGRHRKVDVYNLSQSFLDLPKITIRTISNLRIFLEYTWKAVEKIFRDDAGFNMSYDEFLDLYCNAWEKDLYSHHFDGSKKKHDEKNKKCNENKKIYKNASPVHNPSTVVKVDWRPLLGYLKNVIYKWKKNIQRKWRIRPH